MKKFVKTIAAMQAAVMMMTTASFAADLLDETFVPMDEIAAEMSGPEEEGLLDENESFDFSDEDLFDDFEEFEDSEDFGEFGEEASADADDAGFDDEEDIWETLDDAGLALIEDVDFVDEPQILLQGGSTPSEWKQVHKYYKTIYEDALDTVAVVEPQLRPLIPILKMILGSTLFKDDAAKDNTGEIIKEKLDEISAQITTLEQNLKDHTYNVVSLAHIGDKYGTVKDKATTINTHISDIMGTGSKSYEQQRREIADLYNTAEFDSLTSAMNGATDCFYSATNSIFEKKNIFDAAYDRACEEVMFSREAIDISLPYIMSQYAVYSAAYATMSEVYDAYEEVYGADTLTATRKLMTERLFGGNLKGTITQKSVLDLIKDYTQRDKYVFVNRSNNTNIKLNQTMMYVMDIGNVLPIQKFCQDMPTPDYVKKNPLTKDHVKALAEYCGRKKVSLWTFLFNQMYFDPAVLYKGKVYSPEEIRKDFILHQYLPINPIIGQKGWACNLGVDHADVLYLGCKHTDTNIDRDNKYYPGIYGSGSEVDWYYINAAKMTGYNVSTERKLICRYSKSDGEDVGTRTETKCNFAFFQPR